MIPTYNRATDLVKAVNSALQQTYPVTEVIVCDDGSSDNSKDLIHAMNDPKVKWIDCGRNGRPAIPRNIGIAQSKGNWIAFLDSDDSWTAEKTKKQIAALHKYHVKAVCSNAVKIRKGEESGAYVAYNKDMISLQDLMVQNSVICSSVMIERKLLMETSLFPTDPKLVAEDYALWLRVATQTAFAFMNENLVRYFDNFETSVRSEYQGDNWDMFDVIFSDFRAWMRSKNMVLNKEDQQALKKHLKTIKNKGIPTASEEFFRKLRDKLGIKN